MQIFKTAAFDRNYLSSRNYEVSIVPTQGLNVIYALLPNKCKVFVAFWWYSAFLGDCILRVAMATAQLVLLC
ncbi:hypothetical protein ANO14919_078690 [Xylariales sp. No.14919]|nr:hypothetical protein ANO14919_078690 [Xylariales sp. No.14919]